MSAPEFVGWVDAVAPKARRMRHDGFEWLEIWGGHTYARKTVVIERVSGDWPADRDLIALADGSCPEHPSHFGGEVSAGQTRRTVSIYTD